MAGTVENLVTSTTLFSTYLWFGGIGNTMALVLMMAASKSTRLKALGRACRREMQYSQEQLGFETHLSTTYISHIETEKRKPSLGSLISISNVLGIILDELLSGNQIHNPTDYQTDIDELMQDCSLEEKQFIDRDRKSVV